MTIEALNYINTWLTDLNIPYAFMQWREAVPNTYFIGEYQESEQITEDGLQEADFILTGTTNTNYLDLEKEKAKLTDTNFSTILENGNALVISYSNSYPIPSVEQGVYRIQINLRIKEWKV